MGKTIIYKGSFPFTYYLCDLFTGEPIRVTEKEFFNIVGYNRKTVPMHYDKNNVNRQNFFLGNAILGYRVRG